jgi:dehydrogenase/reductase SDR family protein 12
VIRIEETRDLPLSRDDAFTYVADFANVGDWDPGVVSSSQQGDDAPSLGTRYDVVATFGKSTIALVYEVTAWSPPERVVLATSSKRFDAVDTIEFVALDGDRTRVVYVADFELKGAMRLLTPVVRPMFRRLGEKALDGLVEAVRREAV